MSANKLSTPPTVPSERRTSKFTCKKCKTVSRWLGVPEWEKYQDREQELWKAVFEAANQNEDSCKVNCPDPKCGEEHLQCTHCDTSIAINYIPRPAYRPRSAQSLMNHHSKQCATRRDNHINHAKRPKTVHDVLVNFDTGQEDNSADYWVEGGDAMPTLEERSFSDSSDSDDSHESMDDYFLDQGGSAAVLHAEAVKQEEDEQRESEALKDFVWLDLDPDSVSHNEEEKMNQINIPNAFGDHAGREKHSYNDFAFFDWRDEEKKQTQRFCQAQLYFYQKYERKYTDPDNNTGGFQGLVHRASTGNREDASEVAPREDARQFFLLFNIHNHIPGRLKSQLIDLHHGAEKLWKTGGEPICPVKTKFPSSDLEARNVLEEGPNSIFKNFPVPKVFEISNHACVSIKQVILISAGHGADFNFGYDAAKTNEEQNRQGLNGTRAFRDLVYEVVRHQGPKKAKRSLHEQKIKIGYIYLWSDGFLNCFIKQKDNNVWIITVTICPPENKKSSGKYTHILAIGRGCEDHTKVFEHYLKECEELMDGFDCYFGTTNNICRVAFGLLTLNGDRPERQAMGFNRKEGHHGKVSGMAAPVDEKRLPSCSKCLSRRIGALLGKNIPPEKQCSECFDWTMEEVEKQRTVIVKKDHPCFKQKPLEGQLSEMTLKGREFGKRKIGPVKLSGKWLEKALEITYLAVNSGQWSSTAANAFLASCNVKKSLVDSVVIRALEDRIHGVTSQKEQYVPKIWSLRGLYEKFKLPDLPMHALAHGIITDTMNIFHQILSRYNKFTVFVRFANPVLKAVQDMRLDYCKVKTLPKAAWVGENVMGYTRLLSYLYGMFLSVTPLTAKEDDTAQKIVANMRLLLNSLQSLMSILMTSHQTNDDKTDRIMEKTVDDHMKLLMSAADLLHTTVGIMPSKSQSSKKTKLALLDGLKREELLQIIAVFRKGAENSSKSAKDLKKCIMKIRKQELIDKSHDLALDVSKKSLVLHIQKEVFGAILGKEIGRSKAEETAEEINAGSLQERDLSLQNAEVEVPQMSKQCSLQEDEQNDGEVKEDRQESQEDKQGSREAKTDSKDPLKEQTRCWNKGNWLSFTANIAKQTYYLGCLLLLW